MSVLSHTGHYGAENSSIVGRVCGQETKVFHIHGGQGSLYTKTDDVTGPGGWTADVYTESGAERIVPVIYIVVCLVVVAMFR